MLSRRQVLVSGSELNLPQAMALVAQQQFVDTFDDRMTLLLVGVVVLFRSALKELQMDLGVDPFDWTLDHHETVIVVDCVGVDVFARRIQFYGLEALSLLLATLLSPLTRINLHDHLPHCPIMKTISLNELNTLLMVLVTQCLIHAIAFPLAISSVHTRHGPLFSLTHRVSF